MVTGPMCQWTHALDQVAVALTYERRSADGNSPRASRVLWRSSSTSSVCCGASCAQHVGLGYVRLVGAAHDSCRLRRQLGLRASVSKCSALQSWAGQALPVSWECSERCGGDAEAPGSSSAGLLLERARSCIETWLISSHLLAPCSWPCNPDPLSCACSNGSG